MLCYSKHNMNSIIINKNWYYPEKDTVCDEIFLIIIFWYVFSS